jgi:hypothetical protein
MAAQDIWQPSAGGRVAFAPVWLRFYHLNYLLMNDLFSSNAKIFEQPDDEDKSACLKRRSRAACSYKLTHIKNLQAYGYPVAFIKKYFKYRIHRETCETNYSLT